MIIESRYGWQSVHQIIRRLALTVDDSVDLDTLICHSGRLNESMHLLFALAVLAAQLSQVSPARGVANAAGLLETSLHNPFVDAWNFTSTVPLTQALSWIGTSVDGNYVLFGIEIDVSDNQEPAIHLPIDSGSTLGDALREVGRQVPDYRFEVIGEHLIHVYPGSRKQRADDVLAIRIPEFDIKNIAPKTVLAAPGHYIPLLSRYPGTAPPDFISPISTPITFRLENVTVREILDGIVHEMEKKAPAEYPPGGWIYEFHEDPKTPTGAWHSFSNHSSVSTENWRRVIQSLTENR